ncbi:MAG: SMP-30/gluconolactonase/LRE family protein [Myxococcota bacterium]
MTEAWTATDGTASTFPLTADPNGYHDLRLMRLDMAIHRLPQLLPAILVLLLPGNLVANVGDAVFLSSWGEKTPLPPGSFQIATTIAVDSAAGRVYTVEPFRVQQWDPNGIILRSWGCNCSGIAVNPVSHNVYVSHTRTHRISEYDDQGVLIRTWGSFGDGAGQLDNPFGLAVDSASGDVYVADTGNGRVQVFSSSGIFQREIRDPRFSPSRGAPVGLAFDPAARTLWATDPGNHIVLAFDEFGSPRMQLGSGLPSREAGSFRWPRSVEVDGLGNVYVADTDNERIQIFRADGQWLGVLQGPHSRTAGPFHPRDIAINRVTGMRYALAAYAARVDRFDAENNFVGSFGGRKTAGRYLLRPGGIAVSPAEGDVYILDSGNFLIKRTSPGGAFLAEFGGSLRIDLTEPGLIGSFISSAIAVDPNANIWLGLVGIHYGDDPDLQYLQRFDPYGGHLLSFFRTGMAGILYFERIRHITFEDATGHLWLTDSRLGRAQKLDLQGRLLREVGGFTRPAGIASHSGALYVANAGTNLIHHFDSIGQSLGQWGGPGVGPGQLLLSESSGIATDGDGNVYVVDTFNDRIQQFTPDGRFLGMLGQRGSGAGEFREPADLAFSPDFRILYVLERANHRVSSFCMPGVVIEECLHKLDHDADGVLDAEDNCAFASNPLQEDSGGLSSSLGDGRGDACQCGEVSGDGVVDDVDLLQIRRWLTGSAPLAVEARCSVRGAEECDIVDAVVLSRVLSGRGPELETVCTAAQRGTPPMM